MVPLRLMLAVIVRRLVLERGMGMVECLYPYHWDGSTQSKTPSAISFPHYALASPEDSVSP